MATESPPRKRAKLSLKFMKKGKTPQSSVQSARKLELGQSVKFPEQRAQDGLLDPKGEELEKMQEEVPPSQEASQPPPPYAGLYNVGNTCYLNSVLQTLRYCPEFSDGIERMANLGKGLRGKMLEDQDSIVEAGGDSQELAKLETQRNEKKNVFDFIKELYQIYDLMCAKEDSFRLKPVVDTDMSVNPEQALEALRAINPMFEGYLQHDAQELLCSLLTTLQEACQDFLKELKADDDDFATDDETLMIKSENWSSVKDATPTGPALSGPGILRESHGSLKGGCSPNVKVRIKRMFGNDSPVIAKKHLEFEQNNETKTFSKGEKRPLTVEDKMEEDERDCKEVQINSRKKRRRAKSGSKETVENEQGMEDAESKDNGEGFKKKRLGMGRFLKLRNQSTLLSKFPLLKRRKNDPEKLMLIEDMDQNPSSTPPKTRLQGQRNEHERTDNQIVTEEVTTPKAELNSAHDSSGTPTVIFNSRSECQRLKDMENMFQGTLVLRTKCNECENYTERREDFQDVSVPVQCSQKSEERSSETGEMETEMTSGDSNDSCEHNFKKTSLDWALSQFASGERLTDSNKYFCDHCQHLTEAERFLLFDRLPQVMIIHLKRFSAFPHCFSPGGSIPKINDPMDTPAVFTLEQWCTKKCRMEPSRYRLFGIVAHSGISSSSGHYFSYVKVPTVLEPGEIPTEAQGNTEPTRWAVFDDETVTLVLQQEVDDFLTDNPDTRNSMDTPYLLFYQKETEKGCGPMETQC